MSAPLLPGDPRQLGGFYLDGRLGAGGQGVVYEGYGADGERVAVKALHRVSDGDRDMLRKEVQAWRRVAPFCTTRMLHDDLDGPVPFVVSEYVAGSDLRRAVAAGEPYGAEELRRLAIGVATALVAIHRAGVVHRDLKPENILLGPDGPRVIDFGIARIMEGTATAGLPMGTLRYMPPERYRGEHGDSKVDVWGWGAVILFASTGRHAFNGDSAAVLTYQVATYEPDTSMLEEPLRSLVSAALSKDPADRPTSEQLLLSLVGRADLAAVVKGVVPGNPLAPAEPSRSEVAEALFDALGTRAQEAVPRVLLRLVAPGERAEDTLRSARRAEFADGQTSEQVLEQVLHAFTEAGLLVWEDGAVTLSGAALIRAWPRLRDWVEAERSGLAVHQRLSEASRVWDDHGRRNSDLLQGTALELARDWAATGRRQLSLNRIERDFLDAGSALTLRRGRLRMLLSAVLAVLLLVSVGAAGVAFDQRQTVITQRDRAASAQVAGVAQSVRRTDPQLARRMAVASAHLADTPESWSALLALRNQWEDDALRLPGFVATDSDLDSTGQTLAAAADTLVEFWNVQARVKSGVYTAPARVHKVDLSDDGKTAAVSTDDGYTRLLDVSTARLRDAHAYPTAKGASGYWPATAISPLGTYLLVETVDADRKSTLTAWDTRTAGKSFSTSASGPVVLVQDSSFSPDEAVLSVPGGDQGLPFTWYDTRTKKELPRPDTGLKAGDTQGPVVFSPDGKSAALRVKGSKIRVFDRVRGQISTEIIGAEENTAYPLYFSHDGRYVVQNAAVWESSSMGSPVLRHETTQSECYPRTALRFTADGSTLRCVGADGVVRSFNVSAFTNPPAEAGQYYQLGAVSSDRRTLALVYGSHIELWSPLSRTRRSTVTSGAGDAGAPLEDVQLSRDGRRLAALYNTTVEIWDTTKEKASMLGSLPVLEPDRRDGATIAFALSPDSTSLAVQVVTKDETNTLSFWDLTTMRRIRDVRANLGYPGNGGAVFFQPDGKSVIAAPNFGRVAFPSGQVITKGAPSMEVDSSSDDGTTLYTHPRGFRPYLRLWDAQTLQPTGEDLRTGSVSPPLFNPGRATASSPDGRLFATMHQSLPGYQIKVWDSRTRSQLGVPLTGPLSEIVTVAFTPDGSALTSVDKDGRFFTHTIAPALLIRDLCARSGALTEQEWKAHIPDIPYRKTC
ncbi:WD40 repeat domain-containing serine/threonine-protein kinase [Streptomyces sp. NPDC031705]|uniref:WD40 repeat domain-containing serine/threonine-protein kinase n=1 Tax=Streptomyces sp. NPDC031705 TaxID=3155729 RepID=UPI0033F8A149